MVIPSKTIPAWALLAVGLSLTAFVSLQVKRHTEQMETERISFAADEVTLQISERLKAYTLVLRGGAGLFSVPGTVDRQRWKSYVDSLATEESIPTVQGIGFAELIAPDQLAAHVARVRGEGFPDYRVWPEGKRDVYTAIVYLEPFRDRNLRAFGYDMFSEPVRREAMERARDTGA